MLEEKLTRANLPRGIVPLLETPFLENGSIDYDSLQKLVEHSINGGANGLTAPLVASEVQALSISEREQLVKAVAGAIAGRVPFIVGASADDAEICRRFAKLAEKVNAAAYLVAVPNALYGRTEELLSFSVRLWLQAVRLSLFRTCNGMALAWIWTASAVCGTNSPRLPD
jgi:dihydrodipicolinate synthase/N-acetylneuraminate lyase